MLVVDLSGQHLNICCTLQVNPERKTQPFKKKKKITFTQQQKEFIEENMCPNPHLIFQE